MISTVEDTDTSFEEIEKEFGPVVRKIVAEVTDDKSLPKDVRFEFFFLLCIVTTNIELLIFYLFLNRVRH
jgi:(p)ppGpp synthase/HD superfamily hydrolase